jgi:rubredoxin
MTQEEAGNAAIQWRSWMCLLCGWIYDEAAGLPDEGIAPGTRWKDVPSDWTCPECGAGKEDFDMVEIYNGYIY